MPLTFYSSCDLCPFLAILSVLKISYWSNLFDRRIRYLRLNMNLANYVVYEAGQMNFTKKYNSTT